VFIKSFLLVFLGVTVLGCNVQEPDSRFSDSDSDSEAMSNTRKSTNKKNNCSKPKLIGGEDTATYPSVVLLSRKHSNTSFGFCSGTFIGPNSLITAGHCLDPNDLSKLRYIGDRAENIPNEYDRKYREGAAPIKVVHHGAGYIGPDINPTLNHIREKDVAILIFGTDVAPAVMAIGSTAPALNSIVEIVGFGSNVFAIMNNNHLYRRQVGRNSISNITPYGLAGLGVLAARTNTNTNDVVMSVGDSGGPLVQGNLLVGISSAIAPTPADPNQVLGLFANMSLPHNQQLVANARAQGAVIGPIPPRPTPQPSPPSSNSQSNTSQTNTSQTGASQATTNKSGSKPSPASTTQVESLPNSDQDPDC
jgi:hypothetical protein